MSSHSPDISVRGAYHNNLKNITTEISPGNLTVITGLSGTGKSTLLFDVLHAEGQRKYVETFSPYVRQFLDTLPRPKVKTILNARPSIAVEQKNSIRNSRSTIGTMTGLCDYFKIWFSEVASLFDPISGNVIRNESISEETDRLLKKFAGQQVVCGFVVSRPKGLSKKQFMEFIKSLGRNRIFLGKNYQKLEDLKSKVITASEIFVVVDSIKAIKVNKKRLFEAIQLSLNFGNGWCEIRNQEGKTLDIVVSELRSKENKRIFNKVTPDCFSFNSPQGACPACKGFGKTISIDPRKVIPDPSLSIEENAIKAFIGNVYRHCKNELLVHAQKQGINCSLPYEKLSEKAQNFIWHGDPDYSIDKSKWYGINNFFLWLEKKTYKMHVRVFLSKYRGYFICSACKGSRLKEESLHWKWKGHTLPDLYSLPVNQLLKTLPQVQKNTSRESVTLSAIISRLEYLQDVGLGYLSLNRSSKTLSGGETQRVNLTTCLGSELTDALFALDEPTIGLHGKDIGKLVSILRKLADAGNCVCVVEHDEEVIKSADKVIELGPVAGKKGGHVVFQGSFGSLLKSKTSTAKFLKIDHLDSRKKTGKISKRKKQAFLRIKGASLHNLKNFSTKLPLGKFVCIAGVSGSGKSTLLNEIIYRTLSENPKSTVVKCDENYDSAVLIDQNTISKTPRSNPILFIDGWSPIKDALGRSDQAKKLGYCSSDFSFNTGNGRCNECLGLGFKVVEMQFLSDVQIQCEHCKGLRFKEDLLTIKLNDYSVAEILQMNIDQAAEVMQKFPKTSKKLKLLQNIGLGYLTLGQPLNTLSGGESQRLKLVKYMGEVNRAQKPSILLIDEPTTGLHMSDVEKLIECLRQIVEAGNSLFIIEHNKQMLLNADWILELGPGAGTKGGKVVTNGTPEKLVGQKSETAKFLFENKFNNRRINSKHKRQGKSTLTKRLDISGASENNLKNLSLSLPLNKFIACTGPSGSGKSSLAFDVIFAEGQRRFMESMSSYARYFTDQLKKPRVDSIVGMPPTIAIEQRIHRGTRKSTVGSVTEITQYLRLLYSKLGTQLSHINGKPLVKNGFVEIQKKIKNQLKNNFLNEPTEQILLAPLVTGRKGHHRPIVKWALDKGYDEVRCNGNYFSTVNFKGLDRYVVHDIDLVIGKLNEMPTRSHLKNLIQHALNVGEGRCILTDSKSTNDNWYSTKRVDVETGVTYPELEPSYFSWNSSKGMCSFCRGYGKIYDWMKDELPACENWWSVEDGQTCPKCHGQRLNAMARNVMLYDEKGKSLSLPKLISKVPENIVKFLQNLKVYETQRAIADSIIPEVVERLKFMDKVGLSYLSLDRETATLSGGEAQRIRLAGQLGSNLSGVLYVLDEPSIGLHPVDNQKLITSLKRLNDRGNSLFVVEHDQETIKSADFVVEIGPGAGIKGGELQFCGKNVRKTSVISKNSADQHFPKRRSLPKSKKGLLVDSWIKIRKANYRNLKNVSVDIPAGCLSVCCGVSGSGKSTLVRSILLEGIQKGIKQSRTEIETEKGKFFIGTSFKKAIEVDQKPIGKTSRSTPITYLGIWEIIRDFFSKIPESKRRGYTSSTFSFNSKGGRCENCKGNGKVKLEMNFLPDTFVVCETCKGTRFKEEILELKWNQKNISEVLELSFEEASNFFHFDNYLEKVFKLMSETGLGYIKLGQASQTLSGGEAQRLKLCSQIAKSVERKIRTNNRFIDVNFFILEEPTIGLHEKDKFKLFVLLDRLVNEGNTVIVIEHDSELIAQADYAFELGPGGGCHGGKMIFQGTPERLANSGKSPTAPFLKNYFENLR